MQRAGLLHLFVSLLLECCNRYVLWHSHFLDSFTPIDLWTYDNICLFSFQYGASRQCSGFGICMSNFDSTRAGALPSYANVWKGPKTDFL
jgi:hypothetical protein